MDKLNQYFEILLALHALCSLICATTPTLKDDNLLGRVYKLIEIGGLVIGRAKMR
jgi:hypothetical protein